MYASIRRYQIPANAVEQAMRHVNTRFSRIVSGLPGFRAYYAVDGGGGLIATISVFDSKAEAEESEKIAAQWIRQNFAASTPAPTVISGDVTAHEVAESE